MNIKIVSDIKNCFNDYVDCIKGFFEGKIEDLKYSASRNITSVQDDIDNKVYLFKDHCAIEWYTYLTFGVSVLFKFILTLVTWFIVANYFYSGLFGTMIFIWLTLYGGWLIIKPIINLVIFGLRCFGWVSINYLE